MGKGKKKMQSLYVVFLLSKYTDFFYSLIWFIVINFLSDGVSPLAAMHL